MPARRLTSTPKTIMSAWEAVGIILFNLQEVLGVVKGKQEAQNFSHSKTSVPTKPPIPETPRAVSRVTPTAFSLGTRKTPSSPKLKELLSGLSKGLKTDHSGQRSCDGGTQSVSATGWKRKKRKHLRPPEAHKGNGSYFGNGNSVIG